VPSWLGRSSQFPFWALKLCLRETVAGAARPNRRFGAAAIRWGLRPQDSCPASGRTGSRPPGSEARRLCRQTQVDNIGTTLHNRPICESRRRQQRSMADGGCDRRRSRRRKSLRWKDRKMRLGETNPTRPRASIGGRPLRGAPTGSIVSNWRNKANRTGTLKTVSAVSGPEPLRRIRVWRNKATASPTRPYGAPPPPRALWQNLQNCKTQNELICEISMKSTTREASQSSRADAVSAKTTHRDGLGAGAQFWQNRAPDKGMPR
jgi:hypothetical protein